MTPGEKGQLAVKVILLWTALSIVFVLFVWPHLAKRMDAIQAERERKARIKRLTLAYDQATRIIIDEEIARECGHYEEDLKRKASLILRKMDDDAARDFAAEVEVAQAVLEYRAAADGKKIA